MLNDGVLFSIVCFVLTFCVSHSQIRMERFTFTLYVWKIGNINQDISGGY